MAQETFASPKSEFKSGIRFFLVLPFFLSALFFLGTPYFTVFAPAPIFFLLLTGLENKNRYAMAVVATITNAAIIGLVTGSAPFTAVYLSTIAVLAWVLFASLFFLKLRLEWAFIVTILALTASNSGLWVFYAKKLSLAPMELLRNQIDLLVTQMQDVTGMTELQLGLTYQELKDAILAYLPSRVLIFFLMLTWCCFLIAIRVFGPAFQKRGLDPSRLSLWKAPDLLVWPTLLAGGAYFLTKGTPSHIGENFFKFFMSIYFIQGFAVLSFFFDFWKLQRFARSLFYLLAVFPFLPLTVGLGFFDLWFDFRGKLGQSREKPS